MEKVYDEKKIFEELRTLFPQKDQLDAVGQDRYRYLQLTALHILQGRRAPVRSRFEGDLAAELEQLDQETEAVFKECSRLASKGEKRSAEEGSGAYLRAVKKDAGPFSHEHKHIPARLAGS